MIAIRRMSPVLVLVALVVGLAACGSSGGSNGPASSASSAPTGQPSLSGTKWVLQPDSLGVPVPGAVSITADFTESQVSGNAACNNYSGPYTATSSGALTFGALATTLKACEPAVSAAEQAYLGALGKVKTYAITGDVLTLSGEGGTALLQYSRR